MQLEALVVPLKLDDANFTSGLKRARNSTKTAGDSIISALNGVGMSGLTSFLSVTGAITGTVAALKACVNEYINYTDEVRKLSQLNGTSAEETSRLIQLTDDYEISTSSLTTATRNLSKNGLSLTTETLADLSDEYLSYSNQADRAKFLTDMFGRTGVEFAEIMEQGGDAIRSETAAINGNLIMTQQSINQARQYKRDLDNLTDQFTGLKVQIGQGLIPVLKSLLDFVQRGIDGWKKYSNTVSYNRRVTEEYSRLTGDELNLMERLTGNIRNVNQEMMNQAVATINAADATDELNSSQENNIPTQEELAQAIKDASDARMEQYQSITSLAINLSDSERDLKAAEEELATYIAENPWDNYGIDLRQQKIEELRLAQDRMVNEWMVQVIEKMLVADGEMSDSDYNYLMDYMVNTGLITEDARKRADEQYQAARDYVTNVNSLPPATITTVYQNAGSPATTAHNTGYWGTPQTRVSSYDPNYRPGNIAMLKGYAGGTSGWESVPSGFPNDSYLIGLSSGEQFNVKPRGSDDTDLIRVLISVLKDNRIDENKLARSIRDAILTATA